MLVLARVRVNFCLVALFWIQNENGVCNTLMSSFFAKLCLSKIKDLFSNCLMLCQWKVFKINWEGAQLGQTKGVFPHIMPRI